MLESKTITTAFMCILEKKLTKKGFKTWKREILMNISKLLLLLWLLSSCTPSRYNQKEWCIQHNPYTNAFVTFQSHDCCRYDDDEEDDGKILKPRELKLIVKLYHIRQYKLYTTTSKVLAFRNPH